MHQIQTSILKLFQDEKPLPLMLRSIGRAVGEEHPQKIKYHLGSLEKTGLIRINPKKKEIYLVSSETDNGSLISLPIMGRANCGSATAYADNTVEGYLKVSRSFLGTENPDSLFVLKAKGDSMNKSNINGNSIEDGDFVIVDERKKSPEDKDYIVSLIDDRANIKKFFYRDGQIALVSESTKDYSPIFIHEDDVDSYNVIGKVVKVIKTPKF